MVKGFYRCKYAEADFNVVKVAPLHFMYQYTHEPFIRRRYFSDYEEKKEYLFFLKLSYDFPSPKCVRL